MLTPTNSRPTFPSSSASPAHSRPTSFARPVRRPTPWWQRLDAAVAAALARCGVPLLRISLGIVFFWFGVLKLFPATSAAEELAGRTIAVLTQGTIPSELSVPILGLWEFAIGFGLLTGRALRITLLLLFAQMVGTLTPLILFPAETFAAQPFVPTMEGQYIIKNLVLISGALVIGATIRGGRMVSEPPTRDGR